MNSSSIALNPASRFLPALGDQQRDFQERIEGRGRRTELRISLVDAGEQSSLVLLRGIRERADDRLELSAAVLLQYLHPGAQLSYTY